MWPAKTQAKVVLFIEPKIATHLSDTLFIGKPVKISDLHNIKDFSFGFFGRALGVFGPVSSSNCCNWDLAGLQLKVIFGSNHISHLGPFPVCQAKRIDCFVGRGSIWTGILNHDAARWHISSIENDNADTQDCRMLYGRVWREGWVAEIDKGAISQSSGLISLFQNARLNDENRRCYQSNYYQSPRPIADYLGPFGYFFVGVGSIIAGWWIVGKAFRRDSFVAFSGLILVAFFLVLQGVYLMLSTTLLSTAFNRRSENVVVEPIIVPELELRNVKMQILFADVVECANDTALEDRPKAFNRLGVNCPNNILILAWSTVP